MTDDWVNNQAPTREWVENPRQWASDQVLRCGKRCSTQYLKNREEIEKILEAYKTRGDIPVLFVTDPPGEVKIGIRYAEIINDPLFDHICLGCCFNIVQAYGFSNDVMFELFFRGGIRWRNLMYN